MPPRSATHWLCNFRQVAPPLWASVSKGNQHLTHGRQALDPCCMRVASAWRGPAAWTGRPRGRLSGIPHREPPAAPASLSSLLLTVSEGVTESLLTPPPRPQSPALTLLLEDEACWLRTLPRALTAAEANSEIYRKGWYPGVSLTAFRRVGGHGSPWAGS